MKAYLAFIFAMTTVSFSGCSTSMTKYSLRSDDGLQKFYDRGSETLISIKKNTVYLQPEVTNYSSVGLLRFNVGIKNGGKAPFVTDYSDVYITTTDTKARVVSFEERSKAIGEAADSAALAAAISGAFQAASASMTAGNTYTQGSLSSSSGRNLGSFSSTTYSPGAARAATNQAIGETQANVAEIRGSAAAEQQVLANAYLRKQTVLPGVTYSGYVSVKKEAPEVNGEFVISVLAGGERHDFVFSEKTEITKPVTKDAEGKPIVVRAPASKNIQSDWWKDRPLEHFDYEKAYSDCKRKAEEQGKLPKCTSF